MALNNKTNAASDVSYMFSSSRTIPGSTYTVYPIQKTNGLAERFGYGAMNSGRTKICVSMTPDWAPFSGL